MLNGLSKCCESTCVVRPDGFWTHREMTLLLLAGTSAAGEEFAGSFPAWNKVGVCVIVGKCLYKYKCQCE